MPENRTWREQYRYWLTHPALHVEHRNQLQQMEDREEEIRQSFDGELDFGTGGIRGILGLGPRRMNQYVIRRATQGLAQYLNLAYADTEEKKVAIAYDSRHFSQDFAREAALVLAANGIKTFLFRDMRPTPQLSFAVRSLQCQGGIVVTASHNPPEYNGFKVYGHDGGQLIPEEAKKVTEAINGLDFFKDVHSISEEEALEKGLLEMLGSEMDDLYIKTVEDLAFRKGSNDVGVVYSSLHGTGVYLIPRLLQGLGYEGVSIVEEQCQADPDFTTVPYPNPEAEEAYTLARVQARKKDADIILLTDPDTDRVGCAYRQEQGTYTLLTGNQMGALCLEYLLTQLQNRGEIPQNGVMITTIVTGDLGKEVARYYGVEVLETLTGFKFIGAEMTRFAETGEKTFLFGYEESYGFLLGTHVRDKDAVAASLLLTEMTAYYKEKGLTLGTVLDHLYDRHGYYLDYLESIELASVDASKDVLRGFRENPPDSVGSFKIIEQRDYLSGKARDISSGQERILDLPSSNVLFYSLENGSWFCIRPSGTEPKIKIYFNCTGKNREEAWEVLQSVKADVLKRCSGEC